MATLNAITKSQLDEQRLKLEGWIQTSSASVIKKTADDLFDIFNASDNFVDITITPKTDLEITQKKLEDAKELLAKQETNNTVCDEISDIYTDMKETSKIKATDKAEAKDIDNIRIKSQSKVDEIKKIITSTIDLKNIYVDMGKWISNTSIKAMLATFAPNIKESTTIKDKLMVMLMELACVNNLVELWSGKVTKEQITKGNEIIKKINNKIDQIEAHQSVCRTTEKLVARIVNLEGVETTNPKALKEEKLEEDIKKETFITTELQKEFLDPAKWLTEDIEWYEIAELKIKDKDNKEVEIFEDNTGKKFEKKLHKGDEADIFIKSKDPYTKKDTFTTIGKIMLSDTSNIELWVLIGAYETLPVELKFPIKIECKGSGVGWEAGEDKVWITKTLSMKLTPPTFDAEYDHLNTIIEQDKKLEKMYNNLYEMMLEDQLNKFFTNHPDASIRNGRAKRTEEEKKTFFVEIIKNNKTPAWAVGIDNIEKVRKDNVVSLKEFQNAFKKSILEWFDGKTETQLKEYILEKLGTEPFTVQNPTYAQWLLGEEIMKKYAAPDESKALRMAINKFFLGLEDGSVKQADDKDLYPSTPDLQGVKDINASVADVEAISEEQARNQANAEFSKAYEGSIKRSLGRARMFFFRTRIINNKIKKTMKWTSKGLLTDSETTSAVNRWMLKKELNMAGANNIKVDTKVFNDPAFQEKLNRITNEYLQNDGKWTKEAFAKEVTEMIDNNHELKIYTEKNKITQIGSNLIERVEFEKEQRLYYKEIFDITEQFTNGTIKTREDYDKLIRAKIGEFSKKQNRLPDLVKELWLDINAKEFSEKLAAHKNVLERMRNRTVNMRLNMMINAHPKQELKWMKQFLTGIVPEDKRGLTTAQHVSIDKLGWRSKFYRRMETHPRWTAIGTSIWLAGSAMIPVVGIGVWAGVLFALNYLKKRGHYTKEHVKFEKELLAMTPEAREQYLKDMKEDAEKRPDRLRKVFPKKYDKYGDSMNYLEKTQTLQQHVENIQRYTTTGDALSPAQLDSLREYTIKGIATLKLQEDKGRNFMSSKEGQTDIEKLYNDLYNAVLWGIGRLDPTAKPIDAYNKIKGDIGKHTKVILKNTDYEADRKKMTSMRTKLWLFAGGKAAAIYLTTARLMGQVREARGQTVWAEHATTTEHINHIQLDSSVQQQMQNDLGRTIDFNNIRPEDQRTIIERFKSHGYNLNNATNEIYRLWNSVVGGVRLDDAFGPNGQDLLTKVFDGDAAKFEAFKAKISALQTGDRSSTLWWTLRDIYGTKEIATEKTRAFFDNFGQTIIENQKHELITLTSQNPLSNAGAESIAKKMTSRYDHSGMLSGDEYRIVTNPAKIKNLFDAFANGSADLNNLPTGWNLQTANDALHCKYGGFGDGLKEYIFDIGGSKAGNEVVGKLGTETLTTGGGTGDRNRLRFNSFGVPTFWNEVNNFNQKK